VTDTVQFGRQVPMIHSSLLSPFSTTNTETLTFITYIQHNMQWGEGQSNTTIITANNIWCIMWKQATCFDSTESSSGRRAVDPYKIFPTHRRIPSDHNNISDLQSCI